MTVRITTELFYDLFFAYKNLDIIGDRAKLYDRLDDAASARYESGMGTLQEVVMAQTEKYMLLETEAMQRQKIAATGWAIPVARAAWAAWAVAAVRRCRRWRRHDVTAHSHPSLQDNLEHPADSQ